MPPGFAGKCWTPPRGSGVSGNPRLPFFKRDYVTCLTPGKVEPLKALVADENGFIDLSGVLSGLVTTPSATAPPSTIVSDGVATMEAGTISGLVSIVPGSVAESLALTIVGAVTGGSMLATDASFSTLSVSSITADGLSFRAGHVNISSSLSTPTVNVTTLNGDSVEVSGHIQAASVSATGAIKGDTVEAVSGNFAVITSGHAVSLGEARAANMSAAYGNFTTLRTSALYIGEAFISTHGDMTLPSLTATGSIFGSSLSAIGDIVSVSGSVSGTTINASGSIAGSSLAIDTDISASSIAVGGHIACDSLTAATDIHGVNVSAASSITSAGAISGVTIIASGDVTAAGSIAGSSLRAAGDIVSVSGSVSGMTINASGSIAGLFLAIDNDISASSMAVGGHIACDSLTAATDIHGVNISAASSITSAGAISGVTIIASGNVTSAGSIFGSSLSAAGDIVSVSGSVSGTTINASGSIAGSSLTIDTDISASSMAVGGHIACDSLTAATDIHGVNISAASSITSAGAISGVTIIASGNVTATGSIAGSSLSAAGDIVSVSGDVRGSAITASGAVSAESVTASSTINGDTVSSNVYQGGTMSLTGAAISAAWGLTADAFVDIHIFEGTRDMNLANSNGKTFLLSPASSEGGEEYYNDEYSMAHVINFDPQGVGHAQFFVSESLEFATLQLSCNGAPLKGGLFTMNTRAASLVSVPRVHRAVLFQDVLAGSFWTVTRRLSCAAHEH
eukprot:jgi/Tetstr1/454934/TSEL_041795.t1